MNSPRDSNKCTSDLVCVTDRLKHSIESSNQLQSDPEVQKTKTQVTSKTLKKKNNGFKLIIVTAVPLNFKPFGIFLGENTCLDSLSTGERKRIVLSLSNNSLREQ